MLLPFTGAQLMWANDFFPSFIVSFCSFHWFQLKLEVSLFKEHTLDVSCELLYNLATPGDLCSENT